MRNAKRLGGLGIVKLLLPTSYFLLAAAAPCAAAAEGLSGLSFADARHPIDNDLDGNTILPGDGGAPALSVGEGVEMEVYGGTVAGDVRVLPGAAVVLGAGMRILGTLTADSGARVATAARVTVADADGAGALTLGTNAWVYAHGAELTLRAVAGCVVQVYDTGAATAVPGAAEAAGGAAWLDPEAVAQGRAVAVTGIARTDDGCTLRFRPALDGADGHDAKAWFRVSVEEGGLVRVRYAPDLATLAAASGWTEETLAVGAPHHAALVGDEVVFRVAPDASAAGGDGSQMFFRIVVE